MRHYFKYLLFLLTLTWCVNTLAQTTIWRDIHKVKKKETIFGIGQGLWCKYPRIVGCEP